MCGVSVTPSATTEASRALHRVLVDVDALPETRFAQLKRAGREVFGRVVTIGAGTSVRRGRVYLTTESSMGPPRRDVIEVDVALGVFEVLLPRGRRAVQAHFSSGDAYGDCVAQMPACVRPAEPRSAGPSVPAHSH